MSVFVKAYLTRIEKAQPLFAGAVRSRAQNIQGIFEKRRIAAHINRYVMSHYAVRSRTEAIAATHLAQAFFLSERGEYERALKIIDDLRVTSPEYFEIYRVAAYIFGETGDLVAARQNYEMAIDIDATQPQLFLWFAGFAMRHLHNSGMASQLFEEALRRDPSSNVLLREAARNELFVPDFDKAQQLLDRAMNLEFNSHKEAIIIYDLQAQLYIRRAIALMQGGNFASSVNDLVRLRTFVDGLNASYLDEKFIEHVSRVRNYCFKQLELRAPHELQLKLKELGEWLDGFAGAPVAWGDSPSKPFAEGTDQV